MASASDEVMSACCQLTTQYTAKRGSAESSVDDFDTCRGDVLIRAVTILRYIESQPSTGRFVKCFDAIDNCVYTLFLDGLNAVMSYILGLVGLVQFYKFFSSATILHSCLYRHGSSGIGSAAIHCPP